MKRSCVRDVFLRRQYRDSERSEDRGRDDEQRNERYFPSCEILPSEPTFPRDGACGEQKRERREKVVDTRIQSDDYNRCEYPSPSQRAKLFTAFREEEKPKATEPDQQAERVHHKQFLHKKNEWPQRNVAAAVADIALQLDKREVMANIPEQVWKE